MIVTKTPQTLKEYREMKLEQLKDFCIPITDAVKMELEKRVTEIQMDNFCTSLIQRVFDNPKMNNKYYMEVVLAKPNVKSVSEAEIVQLVGYEGLSKMRQRKLICSCGTLNGKRIYTL